MRRKLAAPLLALALAFGAGGAALTQTANAQPATPTGLITVSQAPGAKTASVVTYSPTTGTRTGTYVTPWAIFDGPDDFAISNDHRYVAQVADRVVRVAKLSAGQYQQVHTWTRTDVGSDLGDLIHPQFTSDGHLMFAVTGNQDRSTQLAAAYSVDPANPSAAPVKQSTAASAWDAAGRPATWSPLQPMANGTHVNGQAVYPDLLVSKTGDGLQAARISSEDGKFTPYRCDEKTGTTTALCVADLNLAAARGYSLPLGPVVTATWDRDEGGAGLTSVVRSLPAHAVPALPELFQDVYLSPDHKTALVATAKGWYRVTLTGTPKATYAFAHLGGGAPLNPLNTAILGWAPHHHVDN